jgi:hypothetical protein
MDEASSDEQAPRFAPFGAAQIKFPSGSGRAHFSATKVRTSTAKSKNTGAVHQLPSLDWSNL